MKFKILISNNEFSWMERNRLKNWNKLLGRACSAVVIAFCLVPKVLGSNLAFSTKHVSCLLHVEWSWDFKQVARQNSRNYKKERNQHLSQCRCGCVCASITVGSWNSQPSYWPKAFNSLPKQGKTETEDDATHRKQGYSRLVVASSNKYRNKKSGFSTMQLIVIAVPRW